MLTKPECLALIIKNRMTQKTYQYHRNLGIKRNANILLSYKSVMDYRDNFCMPKPIDECVISEKEVRIPIQDLTHHQLKKLFELRPDLKIQMEEMKRLDPTVEFVLVYKYGMYILMIDWVNWVTYIRFLIPICMPEMN